MNLFRKKDLAGLLKSAQESASNLRKELTAFDLILLGVGSTIGVGIFLLTGVGALKAGPALSFSFLIAAMACALAALCYAEFAALVPLSGSVYNYTYMTMGEIFAWIIGWDLALEYLLGASTVSAGWSSYLQELLGNAGIHIPEVLSAAPGSKEGITTYFNLPAFIIIFLVTILLCIGISEFKKANNFMVILKIGVVLLTIFTCVWYIDLSNWQPFVPMGFDGVIDAAAIVFFAFIGFDAVSSAAEETKNPSRDLPKGILISLAICAVLYICVALVMTGVVPYKEFAQNLDHPIALAISITGQSIIGVCVNLGAILGMTTVILVLMYGQTRLVFSMSRDGLLPSVFSEVNAKFSTPIKATLFTGVCAALVGAMVPLELLAELVNIGTLFAYSLVSLGVIILRRTSPDLSRPFKCPAVPIIPAASILFNVILMSQLKGITWYMFLIWIGMGLIVYYLYSRKNSKLNVA